MNFWTGKGLLDQCEKQHWIVTNEDEEVLKLEIMRCRDWTDCYFFQECEPDPICLGHCELSAWFISSIVWASIGTLCIIVACFRCAFCPLHNYLVERGNMPSVGTNRTRTVNRMPSDYKSRLPTFEEVVLVRSLSEHNKWCLKMILKCCENWYLYFCAKNSRNTR